MKSQFYDRYKSYSKDELFKIVLNPQNYQEEAVITAKIIIEEQGFLVDLNTELAIKEERLKEEEVLYEHDIIEKAEYYKSALEFKSQNNSIEIRTADIVNFEAALEEESIEFFREDKHLGFAFNLHPTQKYFFKTEDFEMVDALVKELRLISAPAPYAETNSFWHLYLIFGLLILTALIYSFLI